MTDDTTDETAVATAEQLQWVLRWLHLYAAAGFVTAAAFILGLSDVAAQAAALFGVAGLVGYAWTKESRRKLEEALRGCVEVVR